MKHSECSFCVERQAEKRRLRLAARAQGKIDGVRFGSYASLLGEARWRKPALFGMLLCVAGVVGLWGIGNFSPDLVNDVTGKAMAARQVPAAQLPGQRLMWVGLTMILQNFGSFFGMMTFTKFAHAYGRKKVFATAAICAFLSTVIAFKCLTHLWQIFVLVPVMGFFQLALFAGFAIYLPELFPMRLRSTGTSFCYNVGRFVAASGPFTLGQLQLYLAQGASSTEELNVDALPAAGDSRNDATVLQNAHVGNFAAIDQLETMLAQELRQRNRGLQIGKDRLVEHRLIVAVPPLSVGAAGRFWLCCAHRLDRGECRDVEDESAACQLGGDAVQIAA